MHDLLRHLEGYQVIRPMDTEDILKEMIPENRAEEFEEEGEADFSYQVVGLGCFRVNAFRQRGSISIVMRFIPFSVAKLEDLNLLPVIADLAHEERGIILVTGADRERQVHDARGDAGSGQSHGAEAHRYHRRPGIVPPP